MPDAQYRRTNQTYLPRQRTLAVHREFEKYVKN